MICRKEIVLLLSCFMSGCNEVEKFTSLPAKLGELSVRIDMLQADNALQKDKIKFLESQNYRRYQDVERIRERLPEIQAAYLLPDSEGYAVVDFDLGKILVSMKDIKPYANGSKVTLNFGNPLFTAISGLAFDVTWSNDSLDENPKKKEFTFISRLEAGAWNRIDVILDGVTPKELAYVYVSNIQHKSIHLNVLTRPRL